MDKKLVKVFHVPFGLRGFTEELLKSAIADIKKNSYSKIVYLAPTHRKIKDVQKVFHKLTTGAYIPPEAATIKQFSKKLYSLYGNKRIISTPVIPILISRLSGQGIGFSSVISNFIGEIKQYRPGWKVGEVESELKTVFKELNIPEDSSKRALEAIDIFGRYERILDENGMADENDVLMKCPELIEMRHYVPEVLILDGFYEITAAEELIIKKLIEHSEKTFISVPYCNNFTDTTKSYVDFLNNNFCVELCPVPSGKGLMNLEYFAYPGIDEEAEGIARHIKNLSISGKNKALDKITITFPKPHVYEALIPRVFRRYGIPVALCTPKPLGKTRPFLDLSAMLESIMDDYPNLPFSQFLTSNHFKKIPGIFKKHMPQISINSGIIKGKSSWLNIQLGEPGDELKEVNKWFRWIFKTLAPIEALKDTGSFIEISDGLHKLVSDLDFSDGETDIKKQLAPILKGLSYVDNLIAPSEENSGLRNFTNCLRYILNATDMEEEGAGAGAGVMNYFELRDAEPEYLYFIGLKDGDLPSLPDMDLILPDSVRTRLGLVNMKRYLQLQKFIFQRLINSSKNLHLSYPSMEADKFFLPSPFLPWGAETKEQIPGMLCKEEKLLNEGRIHLSRHIREIKEIKSGYIKKRFGMHSPIKVTEVDYYRTCPRKFFIEKALNLKPLQIKEYEIEAAILGTIIHMIMEELVVRPYSTVDEMKLAAERLLTELLKGQPIEDYWKNFIRDSFLSILPDIFGIENKLKEEGYSFMKAEIPVEGEIIKGLKLKGKIDRVDKKGDAVEIIDYKTGAFQFARSDILNKGASLQLFLYAALMKSLGFKVNRAGVYSLKDVKITWIPGRNDIKEGRTMEDYIRAGMEYLDKTISAIRRGDFTALPLNEQTCRNCCERPYCPYIQTFS